MPCKCCGIEGPTKNVRFLQNIGLVFARRTATMEGELCRPCIGRVFRSYSLTTLFLGWWGIISMFVTPVFLINNVAQYVGAIRLPEPGIAAMATPNGLTVPSVGAGSFKLKMIYGVIICAVAIGVLAENHVELMEKLAPRINAKLHNGAITDEADGEYSGVQIGKDIQALEADIKSKDWSGIRSELLARENYLQDLNVENTKMQSRAQVELNANLGANDICENLALTEMNPALNDFTAAENSLFLFAKNNTTLTDDNRPNLTLLADQSDSAMNKLQKFYSDSDSHGCK
jgi:hypothetical protein